MAAAAPLSTEPQTPLWLTCLGGGLFLLVGLVLVFRSPPIPKPEKASVVAAAAPAPTAAAPAKAGAPNAPAMKMDGEALKRMNERLRQAPPAGQPAPGGH